MKSPQLVGRESLANLCVLSIRPGGAGLPTWAIHFASPRMQTGVCTEPPTLADLVFYVTCIRQTIIEALKVSLWPGKREKGVFSPFSA